MTFVSVLTHGREHSIDVVILALGEKGVQCSEVQQARWGSITKIRLPGGGEVGLYQPKHPLAFARTSN